MAEFQKADDDVAFIDAENWTPQAQGAITFEQIVLSQIRRCVEEGSKEMIGGYIKYKNTSKGLLEEYVPDQRQVYIQCIDTLYDLLLSFFDNDMKKSKKTFDDMGKATEDKIKIIVQNKINNTPNRFQKQAIATQLNFGYLETDSIESKISIDEKIKSYRYLFQELILLYQRARFLMNQDIVD